MASEEDGRVPTEPPAKKQRFYFESDMLALKSNPELVTRSCPDHNCTRTHLKFSSLSCSYQKLLKSLAILEAQKIQSIKVCTSLAVTRDVVWCVPCKSSCIVLYQGR